MYLLHARHACRRSASIVPDGIRVTSSEGAAEWGALDVARVGRDRLESSLWRAESEARRQSLAAALTHIRFGAYFAGKRITAEARLRASEAASLYPVPDGV